MSTELQVIERAEKALGFATRKAELAEMATKSERIVEITNTAGYAECHSARMTLKNTRVDIQKAGKEARDDATKFSKAVIAKEKELIDIIEPEETRLQSIQDAWDAERAAEKAARERAEAERLAAIRARLDAIRNAPLEMLGKPADVIALAIENAKAIDVSEFAGAEQLEANEAKAVAIDRLVEMHVARITADAEAERLAIEHEKLEAAKAAQAAEQAELDRVAREAREEADRVAQVERDRVAAEQRAQAEADAAARKAAQEVEDEARRIAAKRLADEQAELDRQKEEIAKSAEATKKAAEKKAIDQATLHGAAGEAVTLLTELGQVDHITTRKLVAALKRASKVQEAA